MRWTFIITFTGAFYIEADSTPIQSILTTKNYLNGPVREKLLSLSFFDIYRLECEDRERGGIWQSLDNSENNDQGLTRNVVEWYMEDDKDDYHIIEDSIDSDSSRGERSCKLSQISTKEEQVVEKEIKEHPLRTDEWLIHLKLSPFLLPGNWEGELFPNIVHFHGEPATRPRQGMFTNRNMKAIHNKRKHQIFKFAKNGYVILMEDPNDGLGVIDQKSCGILSNHVLNKIKLRVGTSSMNQWIRRSKSKLHHRNDESSLRRVTKIGKWKLDTSGVSWSIPVICRMKPIDGVTDQSIVIARSTLHYHADIHLSKFQNQPRMFRGVVTRDHFAGDSVPGMNIRKSLFRPVIATFTAEGIGKDTVDISYKKRGFGLKGNA
jgi:hypothetical protein